MLWEDTKATVTCVLALAAMYTELVSNGGEGHALSEGPGALPSQAL